MRLLALALCACVLSGSPPVRADLAGDVARLKDAWSTGGRVIVQKPRLLERGAFLPVLVPVSLLDPERQGCVTLALLGVTTAHFVLHVGGSRARESSADPPRASAAGAIELSRCGIHRLDLARLAVEMRSPRALLETIVVASDRPLPAVADVLRHRDPGPAADFGGPGPRPRPAPLSERLSRLEARLKRDGAVEVSRRGVLARADGGGEVRLALESGCHELHLLSDEADGEHVLALRLVLELGGDNDEPLAFEPSESSDAAQKLCLGHGARALLEFDGSAPSRTLSLLTGRFPLPLGLPDHWGPLTRARVAGTLRRYGLLLPEDSPFYQSLGVQGVTALSVEVTPGACYVAVLTPIRGEFVALGLAVESGTVSAQNTALPPSQGTAVALCARDANSARFEVEAKGFGFAWLFSVWQAGSLRPGEPVP
jgi:hypothetical protein